MGNEQSAPAPRRPQNKLSKPRTNNHSTANLLNVKGPAANTRRNSISASASSTNSRYNHWQSEPLPGEAVERQKEELAPTQRKRVSLFRSKTAQEKTSRFKAGDHLEKAQSDLSLVDQSSRRWSEQSIGPCEPGTVEPLGDPPFYESPVETRRPPIRPARMSLQQHFSQHQPRLSLVPEVASPRSEKPEGSIRLSRFEQNDSNLALSGGTESDTAIYAPIRRRSLLQHGVATRMSWAEGNLQQFSPSRVEFPDKFQANYQNSPHLTSSHHSELLPLGPTPEFFSVGPRTETPTELDYRHIGAFKLGTLRITNGAASPAPSSEGRAATMGAEDDYILAGDIRKSMESDRRHRHGLSQRSNTLSVPSEAIKAPWIVRSESPLRQSVEVDYAPLKIDIEFEDPTFSLFDFKASEDLFKRTESPTKSLELAQEYMQDLALSPFSFDSSPLGSPQLQATSKHMAVEDDLFEPEPGTPLVDAAIHMPSSFDSAYVGSVFSDKTIKGPRDPPPKPLAKADSGYSSNVSIRSFKKDSMPPVPAKEAPLYSNLEPVSMAAPFISAASLTMASGTKTRNMQPLPSLPVKSKVIEQPLRQPPPVPRKHSFVRESEEHFSTVSRPAIPKEPLPTPSPCQDSETPISKYSKQQNLHATPRGTAELFQREESPGTSVISTTSSTSSGRRGSKLSKRLQSLQPEPIFTIQAVPSAVEQLKIPSPSSEARRKLEERVGSFPVASFANTINGSVGLRHSSSKETLGTIFSVGSAEVRAELNFARLQGALPPVPGGPAISENPVTEFAKPDYNRRNTFQSYSTTPLAPRRERSRQSLQPLSGGRNPSPSQQIWSKHPGQFKAGERTFEPRPKILQEDFETEITSYSSISSSLGRSPYDIAKPTSKLSVAERSKSMTAQFEADAAARFALARQRTASQESEAPSILQRKKSYGSIAEGNPFASGNSTGSHSRSNSREYPPQAHSNSLLRRSMPSQNSVPVPGQGLGHVATQFRGYSLQDEDTKGLLAFSNSKFSPPVTMATQRRVSSGDHRTTLPSYRPPTQASHHNSPQPPIYFSSPKPSQESGQYDDSEQVRPHRRQSAGEVLQTKKSMEMRRSVNPRPFDSHNQEEIDRELRMRISMEIRRPESARPSREHGRPQQGLRYSESFDSSQHYVHQGWRPGQVTLSGSRASRRDTWSTQRHVSEEYDHTYGSFSNEGSGYAEQEFYEPEQEQEAQNLPEFIHHSQNSTSNMLVMDRFSDNQDYGYEHGLGLVNSAGSRHEGMFNGAGRKSVDVGRNYGLDFSDMPVSLQRVKARG